MRAQRVSMYAGFAAAVDTTDQVAAGMQNQAGGLFFRIGSTYYGQVAAAASFIRPELLSIGKAKLDEWMKQDSKLAVYAHFFDDLFRKQDHVRSGEVEELLGMLADPFSGPASTSSLIANADFNFAPAVTRKDKKLVVTQSSIHEILNQPDRKARQTAWNNYMDRHVEFKNTLASNLTTSIKANVFLCRMPENMSHHWRLRSLNKTCQWKFSII